MFLKNFPIFFENTPTFFEKFKVFLHHSVWAACFFNVPVGIGLHIRWHQPARIYAQAYTYICIGLHVRTHQPTYIYMGDIPSYTVHYFAMLAE